MAKALYKLANSASINIIEGEFVKGIEPGFIFADFSGNEQFTIQANKRSKLSVDEVNRLSIKATTSTEWETTSKEDYDFGFTIIKNEIDHKHISKAILSRKKVIDRSVNAIQLFLDLCASYPDSHIFLTETLAGDLWIGATPETLLSEFNGVFETMSLAGTKKELETPWTEKEYEEQRIVTNSIIGELYKVNVDPQLKDLETVKAGAVYHLRNRIIFNCQYPTIDVAQALHPTPAISGYPKNQAIATIKIAENHSRNYYCGFGGPYNQNGLTHLFVNLRCASISQNQICLYVGGGITKRSKLEEEWEECEKKAKSILNFL